jgi:hypothetical protein
MGALYIMDEDGSGATQLTFGTPPAAVPALSPDGQTIAFVSGRQDIYTISAHGGSPQLVFSAGSNRELNHPSWSPDGQRLVFTYTLRAGQPEYSDIYSVSAAGTDLRQLIAWKGEQFTPTYSPDGQRLAFSTKTDPKGRVLGGGYPQIWITGPAGGTSGTPITTPSTEPNGAYNPAYSPTGVEIAFHRAGGTIRRIRSDGIGGSQLVSADASGGGATWSPNGLKIAWESQRDDPVNSRTSIWGTTLGTGLDQPIMGLESGAPSYRQGGGYSTFAAHEFRPRLLFDSDETYRPLDVDLFFGERNDQGLPLHDVCTASGCSDLVSRSSLAGRDWIDIAGDGDADNYHSPYNACTADGLRDCDTGARSTIYYWNTSPSGSSSYYTDYWIFYRYDDWPFVGPGDHEGDWESVTVADAATSPNTFDFASFSQHGEWYSYLRENLSCDGLGKGSCGTNAQPVGGHIDVFVSRGKHANYPDYCDATIFTNCSRNGGSIFAEGSHNGEDPWGNNSLAERLLPLPSPSDSTGWTAWAGKWGAPPDNGPAGPAHGGNGAHFFAPWTTLCADDNADCPGVHASGRAQARAARLRDNDRCATWFGGDVVAAACAPERLRAAVSARRLGAHGTIRLTVHRSGRSSSRVAASAPGVAQAAGRALRPGDRITLSAAAPQTVTVLVRAATRKQALTARVDSVDLAAGERATIVAGRRNGYPVVRLVGLDSRRHAPTSTRRKTLVSGPEPTIARLTRHGGRVELTYHARGSYALLDASATRRGRALAETAVPAGGTRLYRSQLRLRAGASYVRLAGMRRDGVRTPVLIAAIPRR